MRQLIYMSLCVMVCSCASKQMKTSIDSLEKQNLALRGDVSKLQDRVNSLTNDLLVVQSRVEAKAPMASAAPQTIQPQVTIVPSASPSKPSMTLQNSFFGDDIKFSDEEPSLKFTNKDLSGLPAQVPNNAPSKVPSPVLTNKPKGNFTEASPTPSTVPSPVKTPAALPAPQPSAPAVAAKSEGIEDPAIVAAYNKAYKKFTDQNYKETIQLMSEFLKKYPSHPYSDNATFWMGESYFQLKNYEKANKDFERVIQLYPNGNKVPDALLRSGICKLRLSEPEKAKVSFDQLMIKYPESMAAKRAKATLGEI